MQLLPLLATLSAVGCFLVALLHNGPWPPKFSHQLEQWHRLSEDELRRAAAAIQHELEARTARLEQQSATTPLSDLLTSGEQMVQFRYAHKKTYATADPIQAAYFMERYFGAKADRSPFQHRCDDTSLQQPETKNANFPATKEQPHGFTIHFVRNPHKAPQAQRMNASQLGLVLEKWRGNFSATNRFDQFMDDHLGLVFESLDPLVEKWQRDGVPFICRTWCCGPGMPQWPLRCPKDSRFNTYFCEQGCYIEVPHGIIVEALCGLESYNASRQCLTRLDPEQLKIFDLCRGPEGMNLV